MSTRVALRRRALWFTDAITTVMMYWGGQVLALAIVTAPLFAQHGDSVRHVFSPVVVEDSLVHTIVHAFPHAELRRAELEKLPATTVADAVSGMPGVFVRNYGGLGGLKTISLRGASATQTVVIFEGIRLNAASNGIVDLGQLPSSLVERITIERGSRSAAWGAGAIGGAIVMALRQPTKHMSATVGIGAFGERLLRCDVAQQWASHVLSVAGDVQYSRGNYPFLFSEFGTTRRIERSNGDAMLGVAALQWQWTSLQWGSSLVVLGRATDRGAPGAVLQGAIENAAARLRESEILTLAKLRYSSNASQEWTLRFAVRRFEQRYLDSLARYRGPNGADDRFSALDAAVVVEFPAVRYTTLSVVPKAEVYLNTLRGNLYRIGAGSYAERLQLGTAIEAGWMHRLDSLGALSIESALRTDHYTDVGTAMTGLLQARWLSGDLPLGIRASIGRSYRPPSFNELYYQNFGSTNVRPEHSLDVNAGVTIATGILRCDLDGFVLWIRDQIIAVPRSAVTWSVQNAGRVLSRGVELLLRWDTNRWSALASATFQQVTYDDPASFTYAKQVIYTPALIGMVRADYAMWESVRIGGQATYLGVRYTQTDNAPSSALDPAFSFDLTMRAMIPYHPVRIECEADVLNVLDVQYAIVRNFPMPGRSWRIRLSFSWNGGA
ncbi:MAG: TonB-dependent receptor [Chlorobi bacterium]|nr:TonB-dependent receptor [Chlorobiota bacterium]